MKVKTKVLKICCAALLLSLCLISCEQQQKSGLYATENITSYSAAEYITSSVEECTAATSVIPEVIGTEPGITLQDDIIVSPNENDNFSVTFYPVGKGDCIIVQCGGETMMIDSGYKKNSAEILDYLNKNNIDFLDIVIATHPDKDHIGAFAKIIESGIGIGIIYKTEAVKDGAKTYENFILAIEKSGIKTENPVLGSRIKFGNAVITFIGPVIKYPKDINDSSIVLSLEYAGKSFLLTGDMLSASESVLLNSEYAAYIPSDILKAGHHGNNDASSYKFIEKASPSYAVITSDYNKGDPPAESVTAIIENAGAEILRTDIDGLIKFSVSEDGKIDIFTDDSYNSNKNNDIDEDPDD